MKGGDFFAQTSPTIISMIASCCPRPLVIVVPDHLLDSVYMDLCTLGLSPLEFPSREVGAPSLDVVGQRIFTLHVLHRCSEPFVVITTLSALSQKTLRFSSLSEYRLEEGEPLLWSSWGEQCSRWGYRSVSEVRDKGEVTLRHLGEGNGICDLFNVNDTTPIRIHVKDNIIESICPFNPHTQDRVSAEPPEGGHLVRLSEERPECFLFEHFIDGVSLFFGDLEGLNQRWDDLCNICETKQEASREELDSLTEEMELYPSFYVSAQLLESSTGGRGIIRFLNRSVNVRYCSHPFMLLRDKLPLPHKPETVHALLNEGISPLLVCSTPISEHHARNWGDPIVQGSLHESVLLQDHTAALVSMNEVLQQRSVRRNVQRSSFHVNHNLGQDSFSLQVGDYVVHVSSGVGKFLGTRIREDLQGNEREFLLLEYAKGSHLYVPVEHSYLITPYSVAGDLGKMRQPALHTLGSSRWSKTKERVRNALTEYAYQLVHLHARRKKSKKEPCSPHSDSYLEFVNSFPYEPTEDQKHAVDRIERDLMSERVMDRLVCGDVGYGKTEVAMRAAFKMIRDGGRQVAFLAPTTVLAMQHAETLAERMKPFGVRIALFSRLTKKGIQQSLLELEEGKIDLAIGTHRLLSGDVKFKNLGLIILDEEQRFGVKAKEKLKLQAKDTDCLLLSATPIPRTLYLALHGTHNLSLIQTPPADRLAPRVTVCHHDLEVIRMAILQERYREGQIYFIHNRVETIKQCVEELQTLVPQARIRMAHGRMNMEELDAVFYSFQRGEADILVATSIVENGIDIPNANTLIVDRADYFGLSDLYQLKGRVGRWNRTAFVYLLTPSDGSVCEEGKKRLQVLASLPSHGGGMQVALQDLQMRGMGNLLGTEQSGNVSQIGFHLYCRMLQQELNHLRQGVEGDRSRKGALGVSVELPIVAQLSPTYIPCPEKRFEWYQRLGHVTTMEEVEKLFFSMEDQYGPLEEGGDWLYGLSRLRIYAFHAGIEKLRYYRSNLWVSEEGKKERIIGRCPDEMFRHRAQLEEHVLQCLKQAGYSCDLYSAL